MPDDIKCHCGQPLHYSDPAIRLLVERLIAQAGGEQHIIVHVEGRHFLVQRHYIALHGITGQQLLSGELGFPEITEIPEPGLPKGTGVILMPDTPLTLYAWVGADEFGREPMGLKQGIYPGFTEPMPLVSTRSVRLTHIPLVEALQAQVNLYGKEMRLIELLETRTLITLRR